MASRHWASIASTSLQRPLLSQPKHFTPQFNYQVGAYISSLLANNHHTVLFFFSTLVMSDVISSSYYIVNTIRDARISITRSIWASAIASRLHYQECMLSITISSHAKPVVSINNYTPSIPNYNFINFFNSKSDQFLYSKNFCNHSQI